MYRIAKNAALNFVTRQSKVVVLQEDLAPRESGEPPDVGNDAEDPERVLLGKQISETVGRAMTQLQPELAEVVVTPPSQLFRSRPLAWRGPVAFDESIRLT